MSPSHSLYRSQPLAIVDAMTMLCLVLSTVAFISAMSIWVLSSARTESTKIHRQAASQPVSRERESKTGSASGVEGLHFYSECV